MPELTRNEQRLATWRRMTPEQRDYDRFVARQVPFGLTASEKLRAETPRGRAAKAVMQSPDLSERGCSCHINPPCSYCTSFQLCELCEFETFILEDEMPDHLAEVHGQEGN